MIARVVEVKTKAGKARELCRKLHEDLLFILRSHPGFVDEIVIVADHDRDFPLAVSFWKTKTDAEDFHRKHYRYISEVIRHLTHTAPRLHIYRWKLRRCTISTKVKQSLSSQIYDEILSADLIVVKL